MALTTNQCQDIALRVLQFNDMPPDKWLSGFKTLEELQEARRRPEISSLVQAGGVNRANDAAKALDETIERASRVDDEISPEVADKIVQAFVKDPAPSFQTVAPVYKAQRKTPVHPDVIYTDKGVFKSLSTLKTNLGALYPLANDIDAVFKKVLDSIGLSVKVTFLGEPNFTNFIRAAKKLLDDSQIEALGGEVLDGPEHKGLCNEIHLHPDQSAQECILMADRMKVNDLDVLEQIVESLDDNDQQKKDSQQEEVPETTTGTKTSDISQFPYEVVDSDGQGPNITFKVFKDAQTYQKDWNSGLDKDEPKVKAKKRK